MQQSDHHWGEGGLDHPDGPGPYIFGVEHGQFTVGLPTAYQGKREHLELEMLLMLFEMCLKTRHETGDW